MIGRKLFVKLDLSRKLAFTTKWQKKAKEANRFGVLIRRGESEVDDARRERTLRVMNNPNADMRDQMKAYGTQKYGNHEFWAERLMMQVDGRSQNMQPIGFNQRDIYGHYQTSDSNAVDPYIISHITLTQIRYKGLRTKKDWSDYREKSEKTLEQYKEELNNINDFTVGSNDSIREKLKKWSFKEKIGLKKKDESFSKLLKGETNSFGSLSDEFDEWENYFAAHKMMETENWSMAKMDESEELLKSVCTGPFYQELKSNCFNKTIKWRLDEDFPDDTKLIGFDTMVTDVGKIHAAHLYMKSKQSLEVYDRMGNELIYDTEPRLCEEVVTLVRQRPDPFWYGWRLLEKRNISTVADNLPNMKRTTSVRAQKKQKTILERFMRDEAHQSYDIFTGSRKETKARRYDYYHRGWNYGGTQESDGPTGQGSLEWKFSKLDYHEKRHPNMAFRKFTGRNKEYEYYEEHDDRFMFSRKSKAGRQLDRKRARIIHKRRTGKLRPTRMSGNIWEIDQPQPK